MTGVEMEDDKSTDAATDTSVSEDADTSTNEEAPDTDVELEDMKPDEGEMDDDDDDETEESDDLDEDEPASESEDKEKEESAEDEGNQSPDEESEEKDTVSAEEQKRRNDEYARQRIAEREAIQKRKQEEQEKYLAEAEDPRDMALRQLQIDAYNNRVISNTNTLQNGIDKAVASIDLFHKGTPEQKEFLADSLDDFERMYVTRDRNGDPIEVRGDVFQHLQTQAEKAKRLAGVGARQQSKDKSKASARTVTTPSRTPKEPKKDSDLEAFDEEWDKYS